MSGSRASASLPDPDPMRELLRRVKDLESHVGPRLMKGMRKSQSRGLRASASQDSLAGDDPADMLDDPSVCTVVSELVERWKGAEDASFKEFYDLYHNMDTYLSSDKAVSELLATQKMKQKVVMYAADDMERIAVLLEAMDQLKSYVDKPPVENLAHIQKRLRNLEASGAVKADDVAAVHGKVEKFLDKYSMTIQLLSEKLMFWNAQMLEWEERVDQLAAASNV